MEEKSVGSGRTFRMDSQIDNGLSGILQNEHGLLMFSVNRTGGIPKIGYNRSCSFLWLTSGLLVFQGVNCCDEISAIMDTKEKKYKKKRIPIVLKAMKMITKEEYDQHLTDIPFYFSYFNTVTQRLFFNFIQNGEIEKDFSAQAKQPVLYIWGQKQTPLRWEKEEFEKASLEDMKEKLGDYIIEDIRKMLAENEDSTIIYPEYLEWVSYDFKEKEIRKGKSYIHTQNIEENWTLVKKADIEDKKANIEMYPILETMKPKIH